MLNYGDGLLKSGRKGMDREVPARQSENKRRQFARNSHIAATAADTRALHKNSSTTEGIDRTVQSLRTTGGYVEKRSGGKLTGKTCRLLTRRDQIRKQADTPTSNVVKVRCLCCSVN